MIGHDEPMSQCLSIKIANNNSMLMCSTMINAKNEHKRLL